MKTPICEVCLKSNFLCGNCQTRFDNGKITEIEVNVSRYLFELSDKVKSLQDAEIKKIIDAGVLLMIVSRGDGAKFVGKKGAIVKSLAKEFKKSIRVVEEASTFRRFVEDIISPNVVMGINTLYSEGDKIYRIRIPFSQKTTLSIQPDNLSQIVSNIYNKKVEIIFD